MIKLVIRLSLLISHADVTNRPSLDYGISILYDQMQLQIQLISLYFGVTTISEDKLFLKASFTLSNYIFKVI